VKLRYQGVCRGCGTPTAARGGKRDAYEYCKRCDPDAIPPTPTRDWVRDAMHEWRKRYDRPPSSTAGLARTPAHAAAKHSSDSKPETGLPLDCHRHLRVLGRGSRGRVPRRLTGTVCPGSIGRAARYLPNQVPGQLSQHSHAADRDAATLDGWHELSVANPTLPLERLGSKITGLQGIRELIVNRLDAIAGSATAPPAAWCRSSTGCGSTLRAGGCASPR
jgi:hypothetical protein